MLKLPQSEKDNLQKNRKNGNSLKFNRKRKIKLWNWKDSKKSKSKKKLKRLGKKRPEKDVKSLSIKSNFEKSKD